MHGSPDLGCLHGKLIVSRCRERSKGLELAGQQGSNILGAKDASGREFIKEMLDSRKGVIRYPWMNRELGDTQPREKVVAYGHFAAWDWVVGGGTYIDEFMRAQTQLRTMLIGAAVLSILVLCGLLTFAVRALVTRPLREAGEVAARIARGDLTASIEAKRRDEVGMLMRALSDMTQSLQAAVADVRSGSDNVSSAAKQIAAGNADLSQRTEEQASSLEETASSMEELTGTVKQNADNAKHASAFVGPR
jgi:methyl-accepting chemotaxis protein-2 (aspartate sensor receptor)